MTNHYKAFMFLRGLGYSGSLIRKAIVTLSGVSQKELAAKFGGSVDAPLINKVLSGQQKPERIQNQLSVFFGIPVEEMFRDD